MAGTSVVVDLLLRARDSASAAIDRVRSGLSGIGAAAEAVAAPLRSIGGLVAAALGFGASREVLDLAEAFTRLQNQLKTVTNSEEELAQATRTVADIAARTNSDLETTASLYSRIGTAGKQMGIDQAQIIRLTELVSKGMQLGGASAAEYASATLQLSQAFSGGVLRGEEFNSVMEAAPGLMQQIAAGLGVAVGELRQLAEQGALSASAVSIALLAQGDAIDALYGKLTTTLARGYSQLKNESILFVGALNQQLGVTATLGEGLAFLGRHLDALAAVFGATLAVGIQRYVAAAAAATQATLAARAATAAQAQAEAQRTQATLAGLQAQVAARQAVYNLALAEQRRTQEQLRAIEANFGLMASEEALALARSQASTAAIAASGALQRYTAAQAALTAAGAPAAASAGLLARSLGFLAGPAGLILTAVSSFGLLFSWLERTKPAADDLTQSIDAFSGSLERLNRAQLAGRELDLNDAIAAQREELKRARFEARDYDETMNDLGEVVRTNRIGTEAHTRAQAALADQQEKLRVLEERRAAVLERMRSAQAGLTAEQAKTAGQAAQQAFQLQQLIVKLDEREKAAKAVTAAEIAETQALLDRATTLNQLAAVEALTIRLGEQRAEQAQQQANLAEAEARAAEAKIVALNQVEAVQGGLNASQEKELQQSRETAVLKRTEADASQALADKLRTEATLLQQGGAARQIAAAQSARVATAAHDYSQALGEIANGQLNTIRAEIDLARAKGDTGTAIQKIVELNRLESQWTQTLATAKQAEIAAERDATREKLAAKEAIQTKSGADQAEISALRLKLAALEQESRAEQSGAQAKLASGAAAQAAANALKTQNQVLFTTLDYEQKIAAVRNKNLSASERDAQAAHDAELLLAKATLARFDLGDKATEAEIKANQELRQGLIQRAEALAGQVQNEEQAVALLEQLRGESVKLLKDTAEQADITAKIAADDQPARQKLAGLVEWGNSQRVVIPVTFSGSGGGSQGAGLIDELNRRAGAQ